MKMDRCPLQALAVIAFALMTFSAQATPPTTYYIYDESGHVIGEYDSNGNPIQEHIYLGDRPVAVVQNNSVNYVATDQLNTPRVITNASQTVEWNWTSDSFGNGLPTGSLTYNLRLPGQYYDAETGHNYNDERDYDPTTGRYIESDPIGLPGGINTYAYSLDNPSDLYDPTGTTVPIPIPTPLPLPPPVLTPAQAQSAAQLLQAAWNAESSAFENLDSELVDDLTSSDETCNDRDHKCEQQLEREELLCEAIAGPRYPGNSKQAVSICKRAAFQRYAQCLKGVPESERQPLTGVDTPI